MGDIRKKSGVGENPDAFFFSQELLPIVRVVLVYMSGMESSLLIQVFNGDQDAF